jgi:pyruvate/2-oxoglutarate dehydrogenase complex dihydrolipoamide dehydrogenase (E3) component
MHRIPAVLEHDEYDRERVARLRPADWRNPEPRARYHLVVIGGGTAGLVTAAGAAGLGARVALIERDLLGGDCLNTGCVPSKTLIRAARAAAELRDAARFGVRSGGVEIDFGAAMARIRQIRARIAPHDSADRFSKELGVDVFFGEGRFTGRDSIEVDGKTLRFRRAVVASGARAARPLIPGLAEAGFLTHENVFSLTERPRRLAVIGGGPIGCELAQAFQRLGCAVSLIHDGDHVLDREDAEAAAIVQRSMARDGVTLILGAKIQRVERLAESRRLQVETRQGLHAIEVDEVLVGTGRIPNVEGMGLEQAGIEFDTRAGIHVDDMLRTTNPRVFSAGDVCMNWKFTHAADFAARIVIRNALFFGRGRLSSLTMPWCTHTAPEIAHVGLHEREARERGIEIDSYLRPFSEVDRALADGEEEGFVKIHVKKGTDRIVGATIVAPHAGDMISEISVAMAANLGLGRLANVIHPYPTWSEAIRQLGDAFQRTRLTPGIRRIFRGWLTVFS